jgi:hypothetical protein
VRAVPTALALYNNVLKTIEEVNERAVLLRKLFTPNLKSLNTMAVDICHWLGAKNPHIGLLGESLVENIEEADIELMGVVAHTHL